MKKLALIPLLGVVAFGLSACPGPPDDDDAATEATSTEDTATAEDDTATEAMDTMDDSAEPGERGNDIDHGDQSALVEPH